MRKKICTILCAGLLISAVLISLFYFIFLKPMAHYDISLAPVDADNVYHNTIVDNGSSLVQIGETLYYNYGNGDGFRYGTYEITESTTRRVYWKGPSLSPENTDLDNVYDGSIAKDIETYLDVSTGEWYHVDSGIPQELKPCDSFAVRGVWYFNTLGDHQALYRMQGDEPQLLVSADELGESGMPKHQYIDDKYMYYISERDGICRVSFDEGVKQSVYFDEPGYGENAVSKIRSLLAKDGSAYYLVGSSDIYETHFKSGTTTLLYHSDDYISCVNMLGDTLFISENSAKGGIHTVSVTNRWQAYLLTNNARVKEIYLLDSEYVYYNDYHDNLFRINRYTKEIEKVFG